MKDRYPQVQGSETPNWPYMMKVLYEIWFREHGYDVECTFTEVDENTPPDAYIVTSTRSTPPKEA